MTSPTVVSDYFGNSINIGDKVLYVTNNSGCMAYGKVVDYYEAGVGYRAQYKGVRVKIQPLDNDGSPTKKVVWDSHLEKRVTLDRPVSTKTVEFGVDKFFIVN
jgi:hypothetical protein